MKHYTVNLFIDSVDELKSHGIELSKYLRDLMDTKLDTLEIKEQRLREIEKEMHILQSSIEFDRKRKLKFDVHKDKKKIEEIKDTINVLDKDISFFEARRLRYNHIFGENFSSEEFQKLLNKYGAKNG